MADTLFNYNISSDNSDLIFAKFVSNFIEEFYTEPCLNAKTEISIYSNYMDVMEYLQGLFGNTRTYTAFVSDKHLFISAQDGSAAILCTQRGEDPYADNDSEGTKSYDIIDESHMNLDVYVLGMKSFVVPTTKALREKFFRERIPKVLWYYKTSYGLTYKPILLRDAVRGDDVFYPYINGGDYKKLQDDYLKSEASILILLGPAGTGKTTFVRDMIVRHKMDSTITYDPAVFGNDNFFINFMTDKSSNLMLIEDADILLTDRENSGNESMRKLLNVSDGIVKIASKKIIFTANITQLSKIDEALMRPGRCFDVIDFRPLDLGECTKVIEKYPNARLPNYKTTKATIAELFNRENKKEKFGFTA